MCVKPQNREEDDLCVKPKNKEEEDVLRSLRAAERWHRRIMLPLIPVFLAFFDCLVLVMLWVNVLQYELEVSLYLPTCIFAGSVILFLSVAFASYNVNRQRRVTLRLLRRIASSDSGDGEERR